MNRFKNILAVAGDAVARSIAFSKSMCPLQQETRKYTRLPLREG
jgi:hypothetical protein